MSDLDRVLGRSLREATTTGDVAPVMTGGGMNGRPRRPGLVKKDDDEDKKRRRAVAGVIGATMEASEEDDYEETTEQKDGVIPKDAEEMEDGLSDPSGVHVKAPEFKKREPDSPKGGNEVLMSPKSALVAPDVTPDSMTELDPSDVPGGEGETFKAPDVTIEPPPAGPVPADIGAPAPAAPGQDRFTTAMDTLLGKSRKPSAPGRVSPAPAPAPAAAPPISESAAAAMFTAPVEAMDGGVAMSGDSLLRQNQPMPDPKVGDGKRVFEAYRQFIS